MALEDELRQQLSQLGTELNRRTKEHQVLTSYRVGNAPLPAAVVRAKITSAYQILMPFASSNWAGLIVDSSLDRLALAGVRSENTKADDAVWGIWQDNQMDSESKLGHDAALTDGRRFALIWPGDDGKPEITLDDSSQMIVAYKEGSRRHRVCAMRRWVDDDGIPYATLYRPDGIYKFVGSKSNVTVIQTPAIGPLVATPGQPGLAASPAERFVASVAGVQDRLDGAKGDWRPREVSGEEWPLPNPFGIVPVVEIAVNRRLQPGIFGSAAGDFSHSTGHIDRINILTFLGLVVAFWMGFPLRALIGDRILHDDDGNPVAPFVAMADTVTQIEDPQAKLDQFAAADLKNLSVEEHVKQLAAITKTPAHYLIAEMVNLSADAIRAAEGALNSKVTNHKDSLGEGWEEVMRLAGKMLDPGAVDLSPRAEVLWEDHEARSMAERADAALKLKDIMPWQPLAEKILGATQDEIARWESMRASEGLNQLIAQTSTPTPPQQPGGPPGGNQEAQKQPPQLTAVA